MGYDRGDSFPFNFEPNGFPFGSESKEKLSPRSYPIQLGRKWNTGFLSAPETSGHENHTIMKLQAMRRIHYETSRSNTL